MKAVVMTVKNMSQIVMNIYYGVLMQSVLVS